MSVHPDEHLRLSGRRVSKFMLPPLALCVRIPGSVGLITKELRRLAQFQIRQSQYRNQVVSGPKYQTTCQLP